MFNNLSKDLKIEFGMQVDVWSMGCLVGFYQVNTAVSD